MAHEYCLNTAIKPEDVLLQWQSAYGKSSGFVLMRATGCEACHQTGYRSRLALHELLTGTPEMRRLVRTRASIADLFGCAITEGMHTLKQDGIEKVLQGHTTMEQVRAACA